MGGISIWQLVIIAVIVIVLFGTKKLRNVGSDLGGAVKGFKKAMADDDENKDLDKPKADQQAALSSEENTAESAAAKNKEHS